MFTKILIANRGEIAVRVIRTVRDMGIISVAVYEPADRDSLHVRLADEAVMLTSPQGYLDPEAIIAVAKATGAEAIHPGYGFLAERADFVNRCQAEGIVFIGPPADVLSTLSCKVDGMIAAEAAGVRTAPHSPRDYARDEPDAIRAAAAELGYPLFVKSCIGGRGRGARVVLQAEQLDRAIQRAQTESERIYGDSHVYLERTFLPGHQYEVQILADSQGNLVHLGEREGSIQRGNQKLVEESPAPSLSPARREALWAQAVELARLFKVVGAATVEFVADLDGATYFTEIKPRIQVEHLVTEMVSRRDIVKAQIRIAAGEPLGYSQADVTLVGWAIACRVHAEDPWNHYLPSVGRLTEFRQPGGPSVRVDTFVSCGSEVSSHYDSLLAKISVWSHDRATTVRRIDRAVREFHIMGVETNLPLLRQITRHPNFIEGVYAMSPSQRIEMAPLTDERIRRDLAVLAAVAYASRGLTARPVTPKHAASGWHRESRRVPS